MIYSYRCDKCKKEFDKSVPMKDRNNVRCSCGEPVVKLPTKLLFQFVGEGFSSMENEEGKFSKYSKYR